MRMKIPMRSLSTAVWAAFTAAVAIAVCLVLTLGGRPALAIAAEQDNSVQAQMRNVMYHFSDSIAAHIKSLDGALVPTDPAGFPIFDNKESFYVRVESAQISITADNLANDLNSYVFARGKAPLSGISISIQKGRLKVKGRLKEAGAIPFETDGEISPTEDGKIKLHAAKVKALHVPVKGMMNLFGVELSDLIKNGKIPGVHSSEDDLILDPALVFPSPHMQGKVTGARIEGDSISLTFGGKEPLTKPVQSGNYMSYRGNRLAFGKLTMTNTDMNLIDLDASDPFDFDLDHYKEQLTAGYSKITPAFGLRVYMKDFNKLGNSGAAGKQKKNSNAKTDSTASANKN
jgi:hypothetical protein